MWVSSNERDARGLGPRAGDERFRPSRLAVINVVQISLTLLVGLVSWRIVGETIEDFRYRPPEVDLTDPPAPPPPAARPSLAHYSVITEYDVFNPPKPRDPPPSPLPPLNVRVIGTAMEGTEPVAVIDIPAGGTIYDAGLVSIDWVGPGVKMGTYLGLVGAIVDVSRGNGQLAIRLLDDSPNLQSEVVRRFGRHPPMVKTSLRTAGPSMGPPSGTELTPGSSTRPILAPSPVTAAPISSRPEFSAGAAPLQGTSAPPAAEPGGQSARLSAQVDELLRDLDRKRESGMVSEAEYTSRRRELEDYAAELERRRPVGD